MKSIVKTLTNEEIYRRALELNICFNDNEKYFPAAVSFAIQKNKANLIDLAGDIETGRMNIIQHYGVAQEDGNFNIADENVPAANQELVDLLSITQDVKLFLFGIESLDDIKLTSQEMQAIMFMIDEDC